MRARLRGKSGLPQPYLQCVTPAWKAGQPRLRGRVTMAAGEAMEAGTPIAVCSTSNERAVSTIIRVLLGPEVAAQMRMFAGDVVPKQKPAPDIYLLAAKELGVNPRMCTVAACLGTPHRFAHLVSSRFLLMSSRQCIDPSSLNQQSLMGIAAAAG